MKIAYKMWLEKKGNPVFGGGIYRMLQLINETGSLHKAADRLDMSYRAAWGKIRTFEKTLNVEILEKGRHGRTGAHLTDAGRRMLELFGQIQQEMDLFITEGPINDLLAEMEASVKAATRKMSSEKSSSSAQSEGVRKGRSRTPAVRSE